ncbi:hypothetical protein FHR22_003044 [Sphingopyxis panaciterrae]|uniref:hypothetical protein n=1 Tax=Sphingopyxis panaciterrae TaxID=363841 RepID=UPI00141FB2B6|nr:hypothetical protein [Sphingopyxis panaciterrae]NIJ38333.1 hypothetical protein [Sphingopyxis panaciterrae]
MSLIFSCFLVRETLAVAALNAGLNAAYTSFLWQGPASLTLGGPAGIARDLATTPIFIASLSTLLGTAAIRKKLASGAVAAPRRIRGAPVFAQLPRGILWRSLTLAIFAAIAFTAPLHAVLTSAGTAGLSLGAGVSAKVAITLLFSLLPVPIAVTAAGHDARRALPVRQLALST